MDLGRVIASAAILITSSLLGLEVGARTSIINSDQLIPINAPYGGPMGVCIYGDDVLVLVGAYDPGTATSRRAIIRFARQPNGQWLFAEELASSAAFDPHVDVWSTEQMDCDGPIAAASIPTGASFIFERRPSGWHTTQLDQLMYASAVSVTGDTVAFAGEWSAPTTIAIVRKTPSGAWADLRFAVGNDGDSGDYYEQTGPDFVLVAGAEALAHGMPYSVGPNPPSIDTQFFARVGGAWYLTRTFPRAVYEGVAVAGRIALVTEKKWLEPANIATFYERDAFGEWSIPHRLLSDEQFSPRQIRLFGDRAFAISGRVIPGEIAIFRRVAPRRYRHEAYLHIGRWSGGYWTGGYSVDGNTVAVTGYGSVHLFQVPESLSAPWRRQENFQDSNPGNVTLWGQTDWRIQSFEGSLAYRQHNTQGDARAILDAPDTSNQSIEADVRINSLVGVTHWAGFMLRYTDPQNFYYLLVNEKSIQIRRMLNGTFGPLASVPFELALGRTYRLRFEAIGPKLTAMVDGQLVSHATDDSLAEGKAGLTMWHASADYDNVIVTSNPRSIIFEDAMRSERWQLSPANAWIPVSEPGVAGLRQLNGSGDARAVSGAPTRDQIIDATLHLRASAAPGPGWVGLMARYVDDSNYYYVFLKDSENKISLRRLTNGRITVLDEAPFDVTAGSSYPLRVEAIGNSLRAYVNGRLMVESEDTTIESGRFGLVTYRAAADFDEVLVVQP